MEENQIPGGKQVYWCGYQTRAKGASFEPGDKWHPVEGFPTDTRIVKLSGGHDHVLALDDKGEAWGWGISTSALGNAMPRLPSGFYGPCKIAFPESKSAEDPIIDIAAGISHSIFVTKSGSVYAIATGSIVLVKDLEGKQVIMVDAGSSRTAFLTDTGELIYRYDYLFNGTVTPMSIQIPIDIHRPKQLAIVGTYVYYLSDKGVLLFWNSSNKDYTQVNVNNLPVTKIASKESQLYAIAGCLNWSKESHGFFPPEFKRAVKTLLLIAGRDSKQGGIPYHPEGNLHELPTELLFVIIEYLSSNYVTGGQLYRINSDVAQEIVRPKVKGPFVDVGGGYSHHLALSAEGKLHYGDGVGYGIKEQPEEAVAGLCIAQICCGYYFNILLAK